MTIKQPTWATINELRALLNDTRTRVVALEAAERRRHRKVSLPSFMRGEDLKRCRVAAKWTHKELSAAIGKSTQCISQMESGRLRITEERAHELRAVFASCNVEAPPITRHEIPLARKYS